jgi:lysozyme
MTLDKKGIEHLKGCEGLRLIAYKDTVGVWTIGYGATFYENYVPVKKGDMITLDRAEQLLKFHIAKFENAVNMLVKVELTQNQFNALVSFCYNVGIRAFKNSTLLKKLNNRDYIGASKEFIKWVKQPELRNRRLKETELFNS